MLPDRVRVKVVLPDRTAVECGRDDLAELSNRLRGASALCLELTVRLESVEHFDDLLRHLPVLKECLCHADLPVEVGVALGQGGARVRPG